MTRGLLKFAALLSLVLSAALAVLWVRSYFLPDDLRLRPDVLLKSLDGRLFLITSSHEQVYVPDWDDLVGFRARASTRVHFPGFEYLRYTVSYSPNQWSVVSFGYGLLVAFTAAFPAAMITLARATRRRVQRGRCSTCGYNLTGNASGVCPECGTATPAEAKP